MTLLEALQDIGKGRIIDNGCSYELIALGKGRYSFHFWRTGADFCTTLAGTPAENAAEIKRQYAEYCRRHNVSDSDKPITRASFTK